MNKITELIDEVTRMISDLHDGQNPAWQRPDDKEIIKLLEKVWIFLENFEPFDESSKKYSVMKNVQIEKSDRIIGRLSEIFSPGNVVVH